MRFEGSIDANHRGKLSRAEHVQAPKEAQARSSNAKMPSFKLIRAAGFGCSMVQICTERERERELFMTEGLPRCAKDTA